MVDFQDLRIADRLREFDLRGWLNENTAVTTIAAVVLLMVALSIMLVSVTGGGEGGVEPPTKKFFYDLNTGELFEVPIHELPPIERGAPYVLPNGETIPAGVEAIVFAAEDAPREEYVVGWVETLRPEKRTEVMEAIRQIESNSDLESDPDYYILVESAATDRLVMDPNAATNLFVPRYSEPGFLITQRGLRDAAGQPLRRVFPE